MGADERVVDRWLERGTRFFRAVTRNATVRGELQSLGLHRRSWRRSLPLRPRWEQLRSGTAPGISKEEASQAVAVLAQRRIIDVESAARLRGLITTAQKGEPERPVTQQERIVDDAAFEEYRAWLHEWRELARATFKRRDYLIALGLANRRVNNQGQEEVVEDTDEMEAAAA